MLCGRAQSSRERGVVLTIPILVLGRKPKEYRPQYLRTVANVAQLAGKAARTGVLERRNFHKDCCEPGPPLTLSIPRPTSRITQAPDN